MLTELTESVADPRIPTLQTVLNPLELSRHLDRALPAQWGRVRDIQVNLIQHRRARRCTVGITLQTTTGRNELIGKVYAEDRSDVYHAMNEISCAGFGPEREFSIPQPLAYMPELDLLLQEKVHGQPATEIFSKGSGHEQALAAERCAKWIARFHSTAPTSGPVFVLTPELLENWERRLPRWKWSGPRARQLMEKAALLLKRLEIAAAKLDGAEMCACHGDYGHQQIILKESCTVTLDWDGFCVAHPSLDIARFIVDLQRLAFRSLDSLKALDAAIKVFYKTYKAMSGFQVAKQLPFYKAVTCLRCARKDLKPDSSERAEALLDEGLRVLAEEV
jgi:aminoglycoside phosphotransferase (APT) family kinase protein